MKSKPSEPQAQDTKKPKKTKSKKKKVPADATATTTTTANADTNPAPSVKLNLSMLGNTGASGRSTTKNFDLKRTSGIEDMYTSVKEVDKLYGKPTKQKPSKRECKTDH